MKSHLTDAPAEGSRSLIERELARQQRNWAAGVAAGANRLDIVRLLGDKIASQVEDIMALNPALCDLERAAAWLEGDQAGEPLSGKAAAIVYTVQPKG